VCRVYHQTSLQALVFTKQKCLKWRLMVCSAHYAWLVDFDGPWCTNVNTSAWSDVWWHTLHTMPDLLTLMDLDVLMFHQSQQVRHSVQGIPSNVTSGTSVYISTSQVPEVTFDGIPCTLCLTCWLWWISMYSCKQKCLKWRLMVYSAHYDWLFDFAGYAIKRHFRHLCLH
jgi:hypothetical protein